MKLLILIATLFFAASSFASEENVFWVRVGDMIVPADTVVPPHGIVPFGFKERRTNLWPGGILPLAFSSQMSASERQEFFEYCAEMGEFADIQCVNRQSQHRNYLYIDKTNRSFCGSSYVGMRGGRQNLLIRCWRRRTIQHELMHALGIPHEHNRMDRDDHITILWDNMNSSSRWNYRKVGLSRISHYLNYYDFDSIMHYDSRSGSRDGDIVFYRTDLGPQAGYVRQSDEMSLGDHYILYALYGGEVPRL